MKYSGVRHKGTGGKLPTSSVTLLLKSPLLASVFEFETYKSLYMGSICYEEPTTLTVAMGVTLIVGGFISYCPQVLMAFSGFSLQD